jgi:hypothetical protein
MGKPKKRTPPQRTATRRSRLTVLLGRQTNSRLAADPENKSSVTVYTTRRESGKKTA